MRTPIIGLSGGLGNQLFQIARGLALADNVILDVDTSGKQTRKSSDVLEFKLPPQINASGFKRASVLRSIYNGCLGRSTKKDLFSSLISPCYRFSFKLLFYVFNKRVVSVLQTRGIGFHESTIPRRPYLIGYFQTCTWAESARVFNILFQLTPKRVSAELQTAIKAISTMRAIALHIRLGDYLQEKDFGNLQESYYQKALEKIDKDWINRSIWIFSDDIQLAKERLANIARRAKSVTWVESIDNSTAQTWFLMRHASDFVIANSTFSWWAAFLRMDQQGIVCAPYPWFREIESPVNITPKSWMQEQSFPGSIFQVS